MTLYLEDIHALVKSSGLVEEGHCYMGKLDAKRERSVGVYHLKRSGPYKTAIGGEKEQSYGIKRISFLVHWDRSPGNTEKAAAQLSGWLKDIKNVTVNGKRVLFTLMLTDEPIDVGTDGAGIYEMVIETEFYYEKGGRGQ